MIERIGINEINEILETLEISDIVQWTGKGKQKSLKVSLKCEMQELKEALQLKYQ